MYKCCACCLMAVPMDLLNPFKILSFSFGITWPSVRYLFLDSLPSLSVERGGEWLKDSIIKKGLVPLKKMLSQWLSLHNFYPDLSKSKRPVFSKHNLRIKHYKKALKKNSSLKGYNKHFFQKNCSRVVLFRNDTRCFPQKKN